jgi:hypothetical protein
MYSTDAEGRLHAYQTLSAGGVEEVPLPDGQNWAPGTGTFDTGTAIVTQDKKSGNILGSTPKDVAGAAAERLQGEAKGAAAVGLPDYRLAVGQATDLIKRIHDSEYLGNVTGGIQGRMPGITQGQTNTVADIEQLQSEIFPMAIQALRGLGAMSEMEGKAISASVASLDRKRGTPEFQAELTRIQDVLAEKLSIAEQKAQGNMTGAAPAGEMPASARDAGIDPGLWQFMSPEDRALWN